MKKIWIYMLFAVALISCKEYPGIIVEVCNPTDKVRINEMIELDYADVLQRLELDEDTSIIVLDPHGFQIFYQVTFDNKLIFLSPPVEAGMTAYYRIIPGVPEPFDMCAVGAQCEPTGDIVWENGCIAFAFSGIDVRDDAESGCGYDVWLKSVDYPAVVEHYAEKLYTAVAEKNTALFVGDAVGFLDCNEAGVLSGLGATALLDTHGKVVYSRKCESCKILDNGPLRFTVSMRYAPIEFQGDTVVETRVVTLDEGSQLNKTDVIYHHLREPANILSGIALRNAGGVVEYDATSGYVACADTIVGTRSQVYMGVMCSAPVQESGLISADKILHTLTETAGYQVLQSIYHPGETFTYYAGAGWSEWGFETADDWFFYMRYCAEAKSAPLRVTFR